MQNKCFTWKSWGGGGDECRWGQQIRTGCSFSFQFNSTKGGICQWLQLMDGLEEQAQALWRQTATTENAHPGKYLAALILVKQKLILKEALGFKSSLASQRIWSGIVPLYHSFDRLQIECGWNARSWGYQGFIILILVPSNIQLDSYLTAENSFTCTTIMIVLIQVALRAQRGRLLWKRAVDWRGIYFVL